MLQRALPAGFLGVLLFATCLPLQAQMLRNVQEKTCVYGDCVNGRGTQEIKTPAGKAVYRGSFRDGLFDGYGRLEEPVSFTEKAIYDGNWSAGKRNGRGTYFNGTGDLYIGQWKDDLRHGQGSYFVGIGQWREGEHSEFWMQRNTENYTGEFRDDLYHGQGVFRWKNGTRYEGGFYANDRHGFGTFYYSTGTARKQLWDYGDLVR